MTVYTTATPRSSRAQRGRGNDRSWEAARFENGIRIGGIWDAVLGGGAMVGWVGDVSWHQLFLSAGVGIQYFPDFEQRVIDHFNVSGISKDSLTSVQPYIGLNAGFYLL